MVLVLQHKFPDQKLNCRVSKKFNNRIEYINFRDALLAKQVFFSGQPPLFVKADEQLLKTKNLSKRSYGTILDCDPGVLKERDLDATLDTCKTPENDLFF